MRGKDVGEIRKEALRSASGVVLEVGFGSGLNVPYYPNTVTRLLALEPSPVAWRLSSKVIAQSKLAVENVGLDGQKIPLPDGSVDQVVTTWTLCTIPNPGTALSEIRRVLRPGGRYLFVEHGLAPEPRVAFFQARLTPIQRRLCGGCHFNRPIADLIKSSGFKIVPIKNFYMKGPKFAAYLYMGSAER
jgi:ubiquinone/menaquinone biosynthesis C-methylase UbiE